MDKRIFANQNNDKKKEQDIGSCIAVFPNSQVINITKSLFFSATNDWILLILFFFLSISSNTHFYVIIVGEMI